jgi:hypothetical protein
MSSSEKAGFLLGVKGNLTKAVMSKGEGGNEALAVAKNPFMKQQLSAVFNNPADYDTFIKQIENEGTMFKTKMQDVGGSQTAARVAHDTGGPSTGAMGHLVNAGVAAGEGAPGAAGLSLLNAARAAASGQGSVPQAVADKLTPMLYGSSPAANALNARRIAAAMKGPSPGPAVTIPLASLAGAHPAAAFATVLTPAEALARHFLGGEE